MSIGQLEPLPHLGSLTEQLLSPTRLAVAPDDSIFVSDPLKGHIVRFDASGSVVSILPVSEGPIGVAVHPDGRIFVSLRDEPKVAVYDSALEFLEYLGEDEPLVSFVGPTDIDVATDTGRIYVVDAAGDRVYGFDVDGGLALILASRGSWPGEVIYPSAIAIDETRNRIIIADHDKFRLQMFTRGGIFLHQFGSRLKTEDGILQGWMPRPLGLAVDANGRIYITDALMGTVRVFDQNGVDLGKVVDYGHEPGELRIPCDLAVSNDDARLYVANTGASRVEVYDLAGSALTVARGATTIAASKRSATISEDMSEHVIALQTEEPWPNGPHRVEDRPDICEPCHRINNQPGGHGGTAEGQSVLCLSCHSTGGRALNAAIHVGSVADPFGTNESAIDGQGSSHAWGVPAVNPLSGSVGPAPGSVMGGSHLDDGNIKCSTCHEQHSTKYGPLYLRLNNEADAMCKECHAPRDRGTGEGGSHPVGIPYPQGEGEYPASDSLASLYIKDGMVECMTCHAPHGADSGGANAGRGDGMLLRSANDETHCRTCHTEHAIHKVRGEWQPTCSDCHDIHDADSENVTLIAREIDGTPVRFAEGDAACNGEWDFIHSTCDQPTYDGVCEVCHTSTDYHRNSADMDHTHDVDTRCTECHPHNIGFLTLCTSCHGEPPDGMELPNRAGSHAIHLTATYGPEIADCYVCHASEEADTHDNGAASFASGVDANLDGNIDLSEANVCDECHSGGGPFDGVDDPVIGAKANWADGVYDGETLRADKADWCLGCHDTPGAFINGVEAPSVAGDNVRWGYNVAGHGQNGKLCTECHDPTLPHTDGVPKTFSLRFPLSPVDEPKTPEERQLDREAYNNGYRLLRVDGKLALAVPRDAGDYTADDFALCFSCHDEAKILGVPGNYGYLLTKPPAHLQLPDGVAQTNYRNEYKWGYGWVFNGSKPANIHWDHIGNTNSNWNVDQLEEIGDSMRSCVTCHNPHGARNADGGPTPARTVADLAISFDVYNDGTTDREYGYIGSGAFFEAGGDLHCESCHDRFGPGMDPPSPVPQTRYYREWLELETRAVPDNGAGTVPKDTGSRIPERK